MIIITRKTNKLMKMKEIISFRRVLYCFIWKDIIVRYKDSFFGMLWAVFRPVLTVLIFTVIFSRIIRQFNSPLPYSIFVFCGVIMWNTFAGFITQGSDILKGGISLVNKIYFPNIYLPISCIGTLFIDFIVSFFCLLVLMQINHIHFHPSLLIFPFLFFVSVYSSLGSLLILSALSVKYRDFSFLVPFGIQIGFYATPIIFSAESAIKAKYLWFYYLNPNIAPIYIARTLIEGKSLLAIWPTIFPSLVASFFLLLLGFYLFSKMEKEFADIG